MEVRPGYKQTEVGIVPTDWDVKLLGDCATFRTGPFGTALHKSDYTQDGVPVVNPMHLADGQIVPTRTMTITEQAAKNLSEFRLKPGEIVMGRRGDMGRCAVVQRHQSGWLCGTGSVVIRPHNADARFLQRVLSSPRAVAAIEDASVGTTMVNLNHGTLAGLRLQFPSLPEQRAIATALSDVDALLGALDRLIAKKRDLKQAAMQQLLTGQTRLPGFHGQWQVQCISELTSLPIQNGVFNEPSRKGSGCKLINVGDLYSSIPIDTESLELFNADNTEIYRFGVSHGDIFFTRSSLTPDGIAHCNIYQELADEDVVFDCHVIRVRANPTHVDPFFLFRYCTAGLARKYLVANAKTTTMTTIDQSVIANLPISLPPLAEQTAIAEVLSDMDAEIAALEQRREKTRALKQGMMQELLTGRVRLTNGEGRIENGE